MNVGTLQPGLCDGDEGWITCFEYGNQINRERLLKNRFGREYFDKGDIAIRARTEPLSILRAALRTKHEISLLEANKKA